jgi:hypothetical protein
MANTRSAASRYPGWASAIGSAPSCCALEGHSPLGGKVGGLIADGEQLGGELKGLALVCGRSGDQQVEAAGLDSEENCTEPGCERSQQCGEFLSVDLA